MQLKNKVQFITYPDSMGGNLKALQGILTRYFPGAFPGGIHILPPFPSSEDRGFAPITYTEVDPRFGSWEDIRHIGKSYDIMLDLMVNHLSKDSAQFQDVLKDGLSSPSSGMFLTPDKIWPGGEIPEEDFKKIFLRRSCPISCYTVKSTGETIKVWTTFGKTSPSGQIDLDINSYLVKKMLCDALKHFSSYNVGMVRLDAAAYVVKKAGTSCFFVEPEIYLFLDWIKELADSMGIELLPEMHSDIFTQRKLAERGFWIYDFILPYMILYTLHEKTGVKLCEYLKNRPCKQFTLLDCHDGIPVKPDLDNLVDFRDMEKITELCVRRGANISYVFSSRPVHDDSFNVHQIRCSYYSALDCNDDAYLAARAIQFFTPGIPQVYYMGLLAGKNDFSRVEITGDGREINRHNFRLTEIQNALRTNAVKRLLKLIKFRNEHPAFQGDFDVCGSDRDHVILSWNKEKMFCKLTVNLITYHSSITYTDQGGMVSECII